MSFNVKEKPIETFTAVKYTKDNKEKILKLLENWGYRYLYTESDGLQVIDKNKSSISLTLQPGQYIVTDLETIKIYKDKESVLIDYYDADKYKFKLEEK